MPYFNYHALDKSGNEKTGTIIAENKDAAIARVKKDKLYITKIYQIDKHGGPSGTVGRVKKKKRFRIFPSKIKNKEVVTFIRDLSVLIEAGTPLTKALTVISEQDMSVEAREMVLDLRAHVESGNTLSDSLLKYPKVFPELYINLIRAGEIGGGQLLSDILKRLSDLCESIERLNARIRSALTYPIFVLLFALLVVVALVTFILPKFFIIYEDLNLQLPLVTSLLFDLSLFLRKNIIPITVLLVFAFGGIPALFRMPKLRFLWDKFKLKLPIFGEVFTKVAVSRFARNLGALHNSSVPILKALEIVGDATGNSCFAEAIESVRNSVREGEGIAVPLSQFSIFPPLAINMISLGEETGEVGDLLIKVADKYDEDIEILVLQLTSLLEPFLILALGIFVGFIIIALFFPLISVMQQLSA